MHVTSEDESDTPITDPVSDHPPRTKLVYLVLCRSEDKLSSRDIAKEAHLPKRTVQRALEDLRECGAVERRYTSKPVKWLYKPADD